MKQFFIVGILCLFVWVAFSEVPGYGQAIENVKKAFPRLTDDEAVKMVNLMQKRLEYLEKSGKIHEWDTPLVKLSQCEQIAAPFPTDDIHELKPGHISIVASMGDSITAAFAASSSSLIGVKEWRGQSWSIGGDEGETTFPNTLVEFVSDAGLYGASLGTGNREENPYDYLNAAVSGAVVQDMPGQAEWLVQHLNALGSDAVQNAWKVVTIWIGGNNLCDVCNDEDGNSPDVYETKLNESLSILSAIPRTFVNVVPSLDVTELSRYSNGICRLLHPFECRCATSSEENKAIVKRTNAQYTERIKKLSVEWNAKNSTDFAVVVQPFLIETQIPDETYLSSADCFHPSKKAHQAIAVALWNSMIAPAGEKPLAWVPGEPIICPNNSTKFWVN